MNSYRVTLKSRHFVQRVVRFRWPVAIVAVVLITCMGNGVVLNVPQDQGIILPDIDSGTVVNPIIDLCGGDVRNVSVYILIDIGTCPELDGRVPCSRVLHTSDTTILRYCLENWNFVFEARDASEAPHRIVVYCNDSVVMNGAIALGTTEGIQSRQYGYVEPIKHGALIDAISRFERVWWPVVILP